MKPILILDCDGVILAFIAPFRRWLAERHQIGLHLTTAPLVNSLRHEDGTAVSKAEFYRLVDGFFLEAQDTQPPIDGAVAALDRLSADMDLAILTNVRETWRAGRQRHLQALGIRLPLFGNQGEKGPMVHKLAAGRPAVFVDDLPPNLDSALRWAPAVGRLHMVGEAPLQGLIPPAAAAHQRVDCWRDAEQWIRATMERIADER